MSKRFIVITLVALALFVLAPSPAPAQAGAKQGPDVVRDPDMEKDSLHNLEAARLYFKLRKAYVAALQRCEEVLAGNPRFSKVAEVLFIPGETSIKLPDKQRHQAPT